MPNHLNETTIAYARRLRRALKPSDRDQYIDGAAVYMLRMILDLYTPLTRRKQGARTRA